MSSSRGVKRREITTARRALKRARKELEKAALALRRARLEANGPTNFFDAVPKEVLHNVIKFLSRLPHAEKWESHIPLRCITELLGVRAK